jgi:hypothetical protein
MAARSRAGIASQGARRNGLVSLAADAVSGWKASRRPRIPQR